MPKLDPGTQRRQITRLLIVLAVVLFVCGGLLGLYHLNREKPVELTDEAIIELAKEAYAEEDYEKVVELLENPLSSNTTLPAINDDAELLEVYITARQAVPLFDQRHLSRIIPPLTRLTKLQPEQVGHAQQLLEMLLTLERNDDALKQGRALIAQHPGDTSLLQHFAEAQERKGLSQSAFETLNQVIEIEPMHVPTHARVFDLIESYDLPIDPFVERAEQISKAHPRDPRAMMILSLSHQARGETAQALDLLKQASSVPPADQEMVTLLTKWLDRSGLYELASRYIMQHAESGIQSPAGRLAVYRAFENNDHQAILDRLKDSDPKQANRDVLGMWASAHLAAGDSDQISGLLEELKERDNGIATTWLKLIELDQQASTRPAQTIDAIVEVLETTDNPVIQALARRHPYFMQRLGLAYLDAREPEAALSAFSVAVLNSDSWAPPHRRLAEALLKTGRPNAAVVHAREALKRDNSNESRQWLVLAMCAAADPGSKKTIDRVLFEADKLPSDSPEYNGVSHIIVDLLARANRVSEAKQRISAALQQADKLKAQDILSLMRVSVLRDLGLEKQLEREYVARFGMTPGLALFQAQSAAEKGDEDAGRLLIEQASPSPATKAWQTTLAEYLSWQQDPSAAGLFLDLAEQHPDDLALQLAALETSRPQTQTERFVATIGRLRNLAGDYSIHWRLQQARLDMQDANDRQTLQQAAELLDEARTITPGHLELNTVLSRCYLMLDADEEAAEAALTAKSLSPRNAQARLLHGTALHRLGKHEEARLDLIPLAKDAQIDPELRQQACAMLYEQGETVTVQKAIEQMRSAGQADNPALTILARLYSRQGQYAQADQVCAQLMRAADPESIRFVSTYFHQTGRPELAQQAIDAAKAAGLSPSDKLMLQAEDAARRGEADRALELIEQAAQTDAKTPQRWYTAAQLALSLARPDEAIQFAKLGMDNISSDTRLSYLTQHADLITQIKSDPSLIPMAVTILNRAPYHEQAVAALKTNAKLGQGEEASIALARLAQQHPEFKHLNELACDRLLRAGLDERGYSLAKSVMARFAESSAAARVTALAAFRLEDWTMLLSAANAWAERNPADRANADLMRAAAMNKLGRYRSAITTLRPYIQTQSDIDASNELMFEYFTRALVRTDQAAPAFGVLRPSLSTNPLARLIALRRIQEDLMQVSEVDRWLGELTATSNSTQDRFMLATAAFVAGDRLNDEALIRKSDAAVNELLPQADTIGIDVHYAKGQIAQRLGDYKQAEASYRKVLLQVADNPQVMNNLALVLAEQGSQSLVEAEQLAKRATQLASKDPNLD
eukprot:g12068.t1